MPQTPATLNEIEPHNHGILESAEKRSENGRSFRNSGFLGVCLAATVIAILALVTLLTAILVGGIPALDMNFLTAGPSSDSSKAGLYLSIVGSIALILVVAAAGLPLGVATAVFLEEFRPRRGPLRLLHSIVQTNIRNLAGVPSIVYGLIGLTAFVRMFGAFGAPADFDRLTRYELNTGERIVGFTETIDPSLTVLRSELLGEVKAPVFQMSEELAQQLRVGETAIFDGTVQFTEDFEFIVRTHDGDTKIVISSFDVETDIALSDPFPLREITVELVGYTPPTYTLRLPETGERRFVAGSLIDDERHDIDTVWVREQVYTLNDGTKYRGRVDQYSDESIRMTTKAGDEVTFATADIASHRLHQRLTFGDEDQLFYFALPLGVSILAGGLTLMLVVLPIVIIASQESIRSVPESMRSGALALGATKWQSVRQTVLPMALPGILTGAILALSRAIGETAPILVVGAATLITAVPNNLMSQFSALPLQIYNWTKLPEPSGFQPLAAAGIIVLLTILLMLNSIAIVLRQRLQRSIA
ncbi:MAG: ABC transporter permease subunit [Planctomycetota bacterium]